MPLSGKKVGNRLEIVITKLQQIIFQSIIPVLRYVGHLLYSNLLFSVDINFS